MAVAGASEIPEVLFGLCSVALAGGFLLDVLTPMKGMKSNGDR